jgi:hypothetical protein
MAGGKAYANSFSVVSFGYYGATLESQANEDEDSIQHQGQNRTLGRNAGNVGLSTEQ